MRKLAVTIALASTALVTTPALARDKSWYVGVDGGAVLVEDIKFDINNVKSAGTVDHRYGYDVDGVIGYDLGMFRLEAEVGYKSASVDNYRSSVTTPGLIPSGAVGNYPAGTYQFARGRTTALSFMVNGLVDFGDDDGIQGFVGGGVGVARVKERFGINSLQNLLNDSDTVFAYQGLAGVRAPITKHVDASIKYRFFTADNVKLVDVAGRGYNGRYRTHSLLAGLTYNFGGGGGFRSGGGGGFGGGGAGGGGRGMPPQVVGEGTGVVKFFNGQKGFGFVVRDDGGEDVFVHISAVEQAGLTGLAEGQPLGFTLVDRGGRISATDLKIDGEPMAVTDRGPPRERDAAPGGPRGAAPGGAPQRQLTGEKATGTVKFFNAMKGFGFIQRDDGQPDAFVHISAVERGGMTSLNEGDRLEFELEVDRRGKMAAVNLTSIA